MTDGQQKFNILVIFYFLFKLIFSLVALAVNLLLEVGRLISKSLKGKKWTIKI